MRYFVSFLLITMLVSCHKKEVEEVDYRDKYTGTFNFTSYHFKEDYYDDGDTTYWLKSYDTTESNGQIEKSGDTILRVIFRENYTEPDYEQITTALGLDGLVYPIVSDSGVFDYPEINGLHSSFFHGNFITNDSLIFSYGVIRMVWSEEYKIIGKRIE